MHAVIFVLFKSALISRPPFGKPGLVLAVVDGHQMGQGKICFDDQHSDTVQGAATGVAQKLASASKQRGASKIGSPGMV